MRAANATERGIVGQLAAGIICLIVCGGCGDAIENRGEDDPFLRPRPTSTSTGAYQATTSLFPTKVGNWWEYQVQAMTLQENGMQAPSEPAYRERGEATAATILAGKSGVRFDFTRRGQRVRSETYRHGPEGLFLLGAGTGETVTMSSPLPILLYPASEGSITPWDGLLNFAQSNAPGRSYSRVTAWEMLKTPLGEFKAWRVDTVIETNIGGRGVAQIETRWLAPGIGVVRQESRAGKSLTTRVLINFKGAEKRLKRVSSVGKPTPKGTPVAFPFKPR